MWNGEWGMGKVELGMVDGEWGMANGKTEIRRFFNIPQLGYAPESTTGRLGCLFSLPVKPT
jgi:hypothetical protein